jgi:hypothetical protein
MVLLGFRPSPGVGLDFFQRLASGMGSATIITWIAGLSIFHARPAYFFKWRGGPQVDPEIGWGGSGPLLHNPLRPALQLKRAKAAGEVFGRPPTLSEAQRAAVREQTAAGASVSALAKRYGTSRQTVMRARDAALR